VKNAFNILVYRILFILLFSFISIQSYAQKSGFNDAKRAEYIIDISKYVGWADYNKISHFEIAILKKDSSLYKALVHKADSIKELHGKPIKISVFRDLKDIEPTQVLYMHKDEGVDMDLIMRMVRGTNTLVMSENFPFHKSMINFIIYQGRRRFEVNEKRMNNANLTVSSLFMALSVKNEADWQQIYMETETQLEDEKEKVELQKVQIEKLAQKILEQQERIENQKKEIAEQERKIDVQRNELIKLSSDVLKQKEYLYQQQQLVLLQKNLLDKQKMQVDSQKTILSVQNNEITQQKGFITEQKKEIIQYLERIELQKLVLYLFLVLVLLLAFLGVFIYRAYKIKRESNKALKEKNEKIQAQHDELIIKNEEILQATEEIQTQRDEIEIQRDFVIQQRDQIIIQAKEITDSIQYASRIQRAVLPPEETFARLFKQYFVFYQPRDIVSGDFYWINEIGGKIIVTAADCTGHGVPGAFMSMLGVSFLNDIMNDISEFRADIILNAMRDLIIKSLRQTGKEGEQKDGMDMSLCLIDKQARTLQYAGAHNSAYVYREIIEENIKRYELIELKADKMPIGIYLKMNSFKTEYVDIQPNDTVYLFSDGYVDQIGGPKTKKFLSKHFKELLLTIQEKNLNEQRQIIKDAHINWKGEHEQIDDVLVIGFRFE